MCYKRNVNVLNIADPYHQEFMPPSTGTNGKQIQINIQNHKPILFGYVHMNDAFEMKHDQHVFSIISTK